MTININVLGVEILHRWQQRSLSYFVFINRKESESMKEKRNNLVKNL
jgi:hypothetical protein